MIRFFLRVAEEAYKQAWRDCEKHYGISPKVKDLQTMQSDCERQLETVEHVIRRDFL